MTETHRQISNEEILNGIDDQVTAVESALSHLGTLQEDLHAARETVGRLGLENKRIRDNTDGLEKSKRIAKLQSNAAAISLEENDALTIDRSITAAKARAIALGAAAKSACAEILWALSTARRANARAALETILDFAQVGAIGLNLELCAHSILELRDLQYYFSSRGTSDEAEHQIGLLRQLRENFSALRTMCEAEAGLIIPPVAVPEPVEVPAAEYEPITGNRHGTLAQAVAA